MPGKGKTENRPFTELEQPALGGETLDVYLNADCRWKNVPRPVWEYTLGGYQVLKKWLSYRPVASRRWFCCSQRWMKTTGPAPTNTQVDARLAGSYIF